MKQAYTLFTRCLDLVAEASSDELIHIILIAGFAMRYMDDDEAQECTGILAERIYEYHRMEVAHAS